MERGCLFFDKLRKIQRDESFERLIEFHSLIQNLEISVNNLTQIFEKMEPWEFKLGRDWTIMSGQLRVVNEPFNLMYCTPPKCGTTSWQRAMRVLVDIGKGLPNPMPEDYSPRDLFNSQRL